MWLLSPCRQCANPKDIQTLGSGWPGGDAAVINPMISIHLAPSLRTHGTAPFGHVCMSDRPASTGASTSRGGFYLSGIWLLRGEGPHARERMRQTACNDSAA